MKKILFNLATLVFITHYSTAQTFDATLAAKLQNTIDSMRIASNLKGISASVICPGQGMWKGVTGESHQGVPISSDMLFGVGSNSKLFTAVLLLKLSENNLLSIDDSLYKWLPFHPNIDSTITIRQILNHTSGIGDYRNQTWYFDSIYANPNRVWKPDELLKWIPIPVFPAGTGWNYSNSNYLIAGIIAEKVTGIGLTELLRDSILNPLTLDSTFFCIEQQIGVLAHPWNSMTDNSGVPRTSIHTAAWAAGAMYSNSSEMAQWYRAIMNGKVLSTKAFDEMTTFVGSGNYGFGILETTIFGRTVWQHSGSILGGYNSTMMYDTTLKVVICVLINQNPAQAVLVAEQLLSTIINNPVGINEFSSAKEKVTIFPNPTSENIRVRIIKQELQSIKVYNLTGELLQEHFTTEFSIANLPGGIYFVTTQTDKSTFTNKLIKQ